MWVVGLAAASVVVPFTVLFLRADPPADGSAFTTVGLVVGFWAGMLVEEFRRRAAQARRRGRQPAWRRPWSSSWPSAALSR